MLDINDNWLDSFQSGNFSSDDSNFTTKALEVFQFQYYNNEVYRNYCELIHCIPERVSSLKEIPFLPISAFKSHKVVSGVFSEELLFLSSGTTGKTRSKHYIKHASVYKNSFIKGIEHFYPQWKDYCILGLLPSYLEQANSSLVFMVNELIKQSKHNKSGFFLHRYSELARRLVQLSKNQQKTLLIGVSFALLDFVEMHQIPYNPNLIVMETGGMKGRRKEMIRTELHKELQQGFACESIHSEYGMTELLSQAYSKGNGFFSPPPWMKVLVRKHDDPFSYCTNYETGGLNIIDLANVHSCSFIQTDDLAKLHKKNLFEILGRFDTSETRGCNLMVG